MRRDVVYFPYPPPVEFAVMGKVNYFFYKEKKDADEASRAAYRNQIAEQKVGLNYDYKPHTVGAISRLAVQEGSPRSGLYCVSVI